MVQPGAPQQYPQHGQPAQQWQAYPQQQYAQPYPQQQPPPPKKRGRAGGVVIGVLVTLLVIGLAFGGYWLWYLSSEEDGDKPSADTSQDLAKAPLGCGLFTEDELRGFFPSPFETEPGGGLTGKDETDEEGGCTWSNNPVKDRSQPSVHVIVRTHLYKATRTGNGDPITSGVDRATDNMDRKRGEPIGIEGTDDEAFQARGKQDGNGSGTLYLRYRNVVVHISYSNQALGDGQITQPMLKLGELAMSKIVPDEQAGQGNPAAPAIPGTGG